VHNARAKVRPPDMPANVTLTFQQPPGFEGMSREEFIATRRARVEDFEAEVKNRRRATGARVLGRRAILAQNWWDSPSSPAPRRDLNPCVAAKDKWSRIEALRRNKSFGNLYRRAFESFKNGIKDTIFPAGTYWLRRFAAAVCEPWPEADYPSPA
jgi:putative transposase